MGASVHGVGQVVATAGGVGTVAIGTAVLVKLVRVLLLAPMVTVAAVSARRSAPHGSGEAAADVPLVPLFVVGFLAMVVVRSAGLVPDGVLGLHLVGCPDGAVTPRRRSGHRVASVVRRSGVGPPWGSSRRRLDRGETLDT